MYRSSCVVPSARSCWAEGRKRMRNVLMHRAEVMKLGALLEQPPHQLAFLDKLQTNEIAEFHHLVSQALFESDSGRFQRVANASRLLPTGISALISERALGPWLCAQVAAHMPPATAVDISSRLPVPFLADVCQALDPDRARAIIAGIPARQVIAVGLELIRRHDHLTMGRFVDSLPVDTVQMVMDSIQDDSALLRTAFFARDNNKLSAIVQKLSDQRIAGIIRTAAQHQQWAAALALMSRIDSHSRARLTSLTAQQDNALLENLVSSIQSESLWPAALPLIRSMPQPDIDRFMQVPILHDTTVLGSILDATQLHDLWSDLMPLLPRMQPASLRIISSLAENLNEGSLLRVIEVAHHDGLWMAALDIVQGMRPVCRAEVSLLVSRQPDDVLHSLLTAIADSRRWPELLDMLVDMPHWQQEKLLARAASMGYEVWSAMMTAAENAGAWDMTLRALSQSGAAVQQQIQELLRQLPEAQQQRFREHAMRAGYSLPSANPA